MKLQLKNSFFPLLIALAMSLLTSCTVVGGIFKAGMWVGIFAVVLIIAVVLFIISKVSGGSGK